MGSTALDMNKFEAVVNYGRLMRTQRAMGIFVKALQEIAGECDSPHEVAMTALLQVAQMDGPPTAPAPGSAGPGPGSPGGRGQGPTRGGKVTTLGPRPAAARQTQPDRSAK